MTKQEYYTVVGRKVYSPLTIDGIRGAALLKRGVEGSPLQHSPPGGALRGGVASA